MAYNLIGCIFRGIGDSRTPLFTVAVACVFNIAGDLILCAGFKMGTSGAAFATVFAQIISVIVSFGVIRKKELPFEMHKTDIGVHGRTLRKMVGLGAPIALQDLLVSISFLIILAIIKSDIAEKDCRKQTVNGISFQVICRCLDDHCIGGKNSRQHISMEK